jgi:hypothetical protein
MPSGSAIARRDILKTGTLAALGMPPSATAADAREESVRERFWLWGHYEGSHNDHYGLPAKSRITPVEAAFYMAIPNVIFIRYDGKPDLPFDQYAVPFRSLQKVVWSVVGAGGATAESERNAVLKLASENQNFTGVMMDDFFRGNKGDKVASLSVDELKALQRRLKGGSKKLDLWVVLYTKQFNEPVGEYVRQCDVLTLWTWNASQLDQLNTNFARAEELFPQTRKVLGCYMWDYGDKRPMPISSMQHQCEQGLQWLHQGKIEGMIFLASCNCDLNLETVEWTRNWVRKVGDQRLGAHKKAKGLGA